MFKELIKNIKTFNPKDLDRKTLQMHYVESEEGNYLLGGKCTETGVIYIFESNVVKVQ